MRVKIFNLGDYITVCILVAITHGILIINDGVYYDAWVYHVHLTLQESNPLAVFNVFESGKMILSWLVYSIFYSLAYTNFAFKFSTFLALLVISCSVLGVLNLILPFQKLFNQAVAVFTVVYPANLILMDYATEIYIFSLALFGVASYISLKLHLYSYHPMWLLSIGRMIVIILFLLSYSTGSLLVFQYVFVLVELGIVASKLGRRYISGKYFIVSFLFLCLLPLIYWYFTRIYWRSTGWLSIYNNPTLELAFSLHIWMAALHTVLIKPFIWVVLSYISIPYCVTTIILGCFSFFLLPKIDLTGILSAPNSIRIILFGGGLLILALFPYIMVGKPPDMLTFSPADYSGRHALLVGLPISLMLMGGIMFVGSRLRSPNDLRVILACLLSMFMVGQINNYVLHQAQWVKELSIIANIRQQRVQFAKYGLLAVQDTWDVNPNYRGLFAFLNYKWTALMRYAMSPDAWPVAEDPAVWADHIKQSPEFYQYLHFDSYDSQKCRGQLIVYAGAGVEVTRVSPLLPKDIQISITHWKYRLLGGNRYDYEDWLRSLTRLQIIPERCNTGMANHFELN